MDLTTADREINTLQSVDARVGFLNAMKIRKRRLRQGCNASVFATSGHLFEVSASAS
jgi:hypothetical protein